MPELAFGEGLGLPEKTAGAQTYGFIARKGGGKSYAASKLAELLHGVGVPLIAIDPKGDWWGLRLSADAAGRGLNIPVIGGLHGDIELDTSAAERLANYLVESNSSAVLDVSQLRKGARSQFVAVFLESLFAAVKAQRQRRQRMIILEEAQDFAPQHAQGGITARLVGAVADVVRLGRTFGLGVMLITQRPQSVSKEVLNQVECLMVGQLQGKHERDAIKGWIGANGEGSEDALRKALAALPFLDPGNFFCWSPQWLKILTQVRPLPKRTFDASATPELDENVPVIPALDAADADFSALRALLAAPAAALAEGPRPSDGAPGDVVDKLRAELSALAEDLMRAQADQANLALAVRERDQHIAEMRALWLKLSPRLNAAFGAMKDLLEHWPTISALDESVDLEPAPVPELSPASTRTVHQVPRMNLFVREAVDVTEPANDAATLEQKLATARRISRGVHALAEADREHILPSMPQVRRAIDSNAELGRCARAILGAVRALAPISRHRAGIVTGYNYAGGGFRNALTELRQGGFIHADEPLTPSSDALIASLPLPPPNRGQALIEMWTAQLGKCARIILLALIGLQKGHRDLRAWTRAAVGARTALLTDDGKPYEHTGGGFRNALTELRRSGLIQGEGNSLALHHEIWRDLMMP